MRSRMRSRLAAIELVSTPISRILAWAVGRSRFAIPGDLLPGSLSVSRLRCGKPSCHCANRGDPGHPIWTYTFMIQGKKQTQHIPREMIEDVNQRVAAGREFQDAVREVLAANAQLLVLARKQERKRRR